MNRRRVSKQDRKRSPSKKKKAASRAPRRVSSKPRAQNRRKPSPKRSKAASQKRTWRTRFASAAEWGTAVVGRIRASLPFFGKAGAFLVVAGAVAWIGQQTIEYARTADAFAIREVVIEGNHRLEAIDVRRAAGVQIGSNAFEVSTETARDHLLQHPWIKEATVVRRLPNRVRIDIVERTPVALVALDQLYLVSEDGAVFKRMGVDDPADLPVITGIASERFYDDFKYRRAVLLRSMALLQDYEGAGLADQEPVSEIHFEGQTGIELFVGQDGMHVRLGEGQHRQKLRRLRQILDRLSREKARPSYVYLDNVRSPERATVRLQ
jgi:cell division protein FtsQ